MKIILEYGINEGISVESYLFINGGELDRYMRNRLPHPLKLFNKVEMVEDLITMPSTGTTEPQETIPIIEIKPYKRKKKKHSKCVCKKEG